MLSCATLCCLVCWNWMWGCAYFTPFRFEATVFVLFWVLVVLIDLRHVLVSSSLQVVLLHQWLCESSRCSMVIKNQKLLLYGVLDYCIRVGTPQKCPILILFILCWLKKKDIQNKERHHKNKWQFNPYASWSNLKKSNRKETHEIRLSWIIGRSKHFQILILNHSWGLHMLKRNEHKQINT